MSSRPFGVREAFLCVSIRFPANRCCLATSAFPVGTEWTTSCKFTAKRAQRSGARVPTIWWARPLACARVLSPAYGTAELPHKRRVVVAVVAAAPAVDVIGHL